MMRGWAAVSAAVERRDAHTSAALCLLCTNDDGSSSGVVGSGRANACMG